MRTNEPRKTTGYLGTLAALLLLAVGAPPMLALQPGDAVTLEALTKAEIVKGEAAKEWKANQVYVQECWATWCAPCVAAIPHVDSLYDKCHGKGLNVVGVNVFEDGNEKVAKFVQKKGDGMSYPVAYTGLEVGLLARQEKWQEVAMKLDQDRSSMLAMMLGMQLETGTNAFPTAVMEVLVRNLDGIEETEAIGLGVKASLLARLGKKDEAHAAAEKAAKAFIGLSEGAVAKDAFAGYVQSFKTDKPMGLMEAFAVLRSAVSKGGK